MFGEAGIPGNQLEMADHTIDKIAAQHGVRAIAIDGNSGGRQQPTELAEAEEVDMRAARPDRRNILAPWFQLLFQSAQHGRAIGEVEEDFGEGQPLERAMVIRY